MVVATSSLQRNSFIKLRVIDVRVTDSQLASRTGVLLPRTQPDAMALSVLNVAEGSGGDLFDAPPRFSFKRSHPRATG